MFQVSLFMLFIVCAGLIMVIQDGEIRTLRAANEKLERWKDRIIGG